MKPCPQQEKDKLRLELAKQLSAYQAAGGKVEQVPQGTSKPVDASNGWPEGFCINDNVGFGRKKPYKRVKQ